MSTFRAALADRGPTTQQLRYLGAALAYLVAAFHLFHPQRGISRLAALFSTGNAALLATDPRPLLFVLSGVAIVVAVKLVLLGVPRRPVYAAGALLMVTYVASFFGWHLSGHGGFLPMREPAYHGMTPVGAVVAHLQTYPLARVALVLELALAVVLVGLFLREA